WRASPCASASNLRAPGYRSSGVPMTDSLQRDQAALEAEHAEPIPHEPSEITYDEQFFPARPENLRRRRPSARRVLRDFAKHAFSGSPTADNEAYVKWLVEQSMLWDAKQLAIQLSGQGSMWQNPYAHPDPRAAVERASVWFTAYPPSFITRSGESFLSGL